MLFIVVDYNNVNAKSVAETSQNFPIVKFDTVYFQYFNWAYI